MYLTVMI